VSGKNEKYGGFLLTELTISLIILGILLGGLIFSLHGFAKFNRYQLVRQQCIAAAQAELDSIAATGEPISDEHFKKLWPQLSVSINKSAGFGQWQGTELVQVTANGKSFRKEIKIQLSRYIVETDNSDEGK
jgi:type II secretory pathway pseudopilin PulG